METKTIMISGGIAAVAAFLFWPRKAQQEVKQSGGSVQSPMPLFISGGGGGGILPSQMATQQEPLGGFQWAPPPADVANDPNVKIAEIQAGVQMANIQAGKETAIEIAKLTNQGVNATTTTPEQRPNTKPRASMDEAVAYIKSLGAITQDKAFQVYDKASQFGFNKFDVAEAFGRAGVAGVGTNTVDQFINQYNLKPLNGA